MEGAGETAECARGERERGRESLCTHDLSFFHRVSIAINLVPILLSLCSHGLLGGITPRIVFPSTTRFTNHVVLIRKMKKKTGPGRERLDS